RGSGNDLDFLEFVFVVQELLKHRRKLRHAYECIGKTELKMVRKIGFSFRYYHNRFVSGFIFWNLSLNCRRVDVVEVLRLRILCDLYWFLLIHTGGRIGGSLYDIPLLVVMAFSSPFGFGIVLLGKEGELEVDGLL
nr:hypothetical protein [Tanacetum cinerariifolium]